MTAILPIIFLFPYNMQYIFFFPSQVNLKQGVPSDCSVETCTAGAGTLVLEFGILGRLLNDPTLEYVARKALDSLWRFRSKATGLFGKQRGFTVCLSAKHFTHLIEFCKDCIPMLAGLCVIESCQSEAASPKRSRS